MVEDLIWDSIWIYFQNEEEEMYFRRSVGVNKMGEIENVSIGINHAVYSLRTNRGRQNGSPL